MPGVWSDVRSALLASTVALLLLLAAGVTFLFMFPPERREGVLQVVPCVSEAEAVANASSPFARTPLGVASVDPNLWGARLIEDERLEGYASIRCEPEGLLRIKVDLSSSSRGSPVEVLAYPSVVYGLKPWDSKAEHPGGVEPLPLPLRLRELPLITALAEYAVIMRSARFNIAYDMWIVRKPAAGAGPGDLEVMVWLSWSNVTPPGYLARVVEIPAVVNGTRRALKWEVRVIPQTGAGWAYIAFLPQQPIERGAVALNLTLFIHYSLSVLQELQPDRWHSRYTEELYLTSIELGSEVFHSHRVLLEWEIHRYVITVHPQPALPFMPRAVEAALASLCCAKLSSQG